MAGTNNISVHVVADTSEFTAAMTAASAQAEKFGATVNKAGATQAAVAGERELAAAARTTAQSWVASRSAIIDSETRMTALLKAGRKVDAGSLAASLTEMEQRRDAYLATTRAYYGTLSADRASSFALQEAAANAEIEKTYQQIAARADEVLATREETAALNENTVAVGFNAQAQRELGYAISEVATGRMERADTSILSLANRLGIMRAIMSPLGLTIAGLSAATIGMGIAAAVGEHHEAQLQDALLVTGDAAGMTTDQLRGMASSLATGDTTIGEAQDAVLTLAQSGKVSGESFRYAAQAVLDFADLTGQKTAEAARYVENLATATTSGLIRANDQYHFLDLSEFQHIERLRQEGKTAEATQAIMTDFYDAMASREKQAVAQQGYLIRALHGVERAFSGALHSVESLGVPDTVNQKIAHLRGELAELKATAGSFTSAAGYRADSSQRIASIEAEIAALEREKHAQEAVARAHAAADKSTEDAIAKEYGPKAKASASHHEASTYGAQQYEEALRAIAQASEQAANREIEDDNRVLSSMLRVSNMATQAADRVLQIRVSAADQALDAAVSAGQMSASQREAIETRLTDALYAEDLKRLQDELATLTQGTTAYQQVADQVETLEATHYQRLEALNRQYQETKQREERQALAERRRNIQHVESMENQMLSGLISGRMTFAGMERRIFQQTAAAEIEAVMHSVTESLMLHQEASIKTLALKAETGLKTIESDAAQAAAGAYKAMVGIPYVGPILAPAAAAVAFAAVGAYKAMVSFDVGAWNIPQDVTARVHAGEMVLPRPFAEDFRNAVSGGGGAAGAVHLHVHANDGDDARRFLMQNTEAVADAIRAAHRTGAFSQ